MIKIVIKIHIKNQIFKNKFMKNKKNNITK